MIKENNTRVTVVMPKDLLKIIRAEAEYEDRSVSNTILRILKKHYKFKADEE